MSAPHNHRDLFAVRMFGKIDLDLKNKRVAFSQRDIHILCENTHAQSAVRIIFYFYYYDFIFGG